MCQVDDVIAVIETDKVSIDIRTDFAGVITEQLAGIDDTLEVNAPLFKIDTSKSEGTAPAPPASEPAAASTPEPAATPSTPSTPPPAAASTPPPPSAPKAAESKGSIPPPPPPSPGALMDRSQTRVQMSRMRQTIAKHLKS